MRWAAKIDANQHAIVKVLRAVGASVQSLAAVGKGVPDLLVGYRKQTFLLEVKDGAKVPSGRKLTPMEVEWAQSWRGAPVAVVLSADDALAVIGAHAGLRAGQ